MNVHSDKNPLPGLASMLAIGFLCLCFGFGAAGEEGQGDACGTLVLTWAGVIDNGEGDEPPHGPYGSLHILVYEADAADPEDQQAYAAPLAHVYLSGPTSAGGSKREWLDGDEKDFQDLEVFRWRRPDDAVAVLIYESDPSSFTFDFLDTTFRLEGKRKHDRLFFSRVSRLDTASSPVTLSSENVRFATGDALRNVESSEPAKKWMRRAFDSMISNAATEGQGLPGGGLPAMLVSLATVQNTRETTKNYR